MDRNSIILEHINKDNYGIEIGPSYNPIASKREGYKVSIIDHMSKGELIEKYKNHPVLVDNIEEVDYIWKGESYQQLTGKESFYDWIIASHLIEHTPDLIGFLQNCSGVLKDDGIISLVIPDKRFCFDHFRPITSLSKIIDAFYNKNIVHTPGTFAEFSLFAVRKNEDIAWDINTQGDYTFADSLDNAIKTMRKALNTGEYIDVHSWCFTPSSFALLIYDLFSLKFIPFQVFSIHSNNEYEFYVTLKKTNDSLHSLERISYLKNIDLELYPFDTSLQDKLEKMTEYQKELEKKLEFMKNSKLELEQKVELIESSKLELEQKMEFMESSKLELEQKVEFMEKSRFWKLRCLWFRLKSFGKLETLG